MLIQNLPDILSGKLQPKAQDDSKATYDALINKGDGIVDWTRPAELVERQIRAYAVWPKSLAAVGNHQIIIHEADVVKTSGQPGEFTTENKELVVHCGVDSLSLRTVQPLNKKEMPVQAFLAGYAL